MVRQIPDDPIERTRGDDVAQGIRTRVNRLSFPRKAGTHDHRLAQMNFRPWSCWGGRPPTASLCQNEVAEISNEGAVHERDYPDWYGHVQDCFSAAWG